MKNKYFLLTIILLLCTFPLFHCSRKKEKEYNFILITLDTQRADFISAYSRTHASTPNIDFLAAKGILYENCYSLIPITLPSHASIFFSQPPHLVKNYNNGQNITKQRKMPSFVNVFKGTGFTTAAFISLGVLKAKFGLDDGFDLYQDDFPEGRWYLTAEEINLNVFPWLEKNKDNKFFLWIHYSDPHDPYAPPYSPPDLKIFLNNKPIGEFTLNKYIKHEIILNLQKGKNLLRFDVDNEFKKGKKGYQARFDIFDFAPHPDQENLEIQLPRGWFIQREKSTFFCRKTADVEIKDKSAPSKISLTFRGRLVLPIEGTREFYKREVEYMDREIGKLLEKLKELRLSKKTHILMVGDHGEGLGEYRGYFSRRHIGHIHFLYEVYMKVPLIIYSPTAIKRGIRREEPVTLLDIAPTIMEIMGFKKLPSFQGRNILSLNNEEITIFEETYQPEAYTDKFAFLKFPWHLILTPKERKYELYDLSEDPDERENIYQDIHLPPEVLSLKKNLDSLALSILKGKKDIKIDDRTKEMLKALGYIK